MSTKVKQEVTNIKVRQWHLLKAYTHIRCGVVYSKQPNVWVLTTVLCFHSPVILKTNPKN